MEILHPNENCTPLFKIIYLVRYDDELIELFKFHPYGLFRDFQTLRLSFQSLHSRHYKTFRHLVMELRALGLVQIKAIGYEDDTPILHQL